MILGFTGTRKGLTPAQRAQLPSVLVVQPLLKSSDGMFGIDPIRTLHGGAAGADQEFHDWLMEATPWMSVPPLIEIYPTEDRAQLWYSRDSRQVNWCVHPGSDPLTRNRIIATRCDALLACPAEATEQLRSGTWSTVRYARKASKPVTLLLPDGKVREERP